MLVRSGGISISEDSDVHENYALVPLKVSLYYRANDPGAAPVCWDLTRAQKCTAPDTPPIIGPIRPGPGSETSARGVEPAARRTR